MHSMPFPCEDPDGRLTDDLHMRRFVGSSRGGKPVPFCAIRAAFRPGERSASVLWRHSNAARLATRKAVWVADCGRGFHDRLGLRVTIRKLSVWPGVLRCFHKTGGVVKDLENPV
jgi:hypothetical protein